MVVKILFKFFSFGYLLILILIAGCATTTVDTNKNLDNSKTSASNITKRMSKKVNSEEKTSGNDQNDLQIDKKSSEQENQLSESEAFEESKPSALPKIRMPKNKKNKTQECLNWMRFQTRN